LKINTIGANKLQNQKKQAASVPYMDLTNSVIIFNYIFRLRHTRTQLSPSLLARCTSKSWFEYRSKI